MTMKEMSCSGGGMKISLTKGEMSLSRKQQEESLVVFWFFFPHLVVFH